MEKLPTSLIPELSLWNEGRGISVSAWISGVGRFDHAIGYLSVFWPDLVEYRDCILRTTPNKTSLDQWFQELGGDTSKVEAVVNHVHIEDLFSASDFRPSKLLLSHLGKTLRDMWASKLRQDFPQRNFNVELIEDTETVTLTFYQVKKTEYA